MKKIISTDRAPAPIGYYSQAVESNGLIFVSGQLGIDPKTGKLVEGGVEEEARQALKNVFGILESEGSHPLAVIRTTIFLTDMSKFTAVNMIYGEMFKRDFPGRCCIGVSSLPMNAQIEITAIALAFTSNHVKNDILGMSMWQS